MELSIESLRENGLTITPDVVAAELVPGREDLARQAVDECPVCGEASGELVGVLYLRTDRGTTLGSGAHPGFLCRVHLDCGDWLPAYVDEGTRRDDSHDGEPVCDGCITTAGESLDDYPLLAASDVGPCWSCLMTARENEARRREEAAYEQAAGEV